MRFEKRGDYIKERKRLMKIPIEELEYQLGVLWEKRYEEQDILYESQHRLTSSVYLERTRSGDSLIFHLKNFLG